MRALLLACLLLATTGGAAGHAPATCSPARGFPSAAGWALGPGETLTFYVPRDQFITVTSGAPIDVTMVVNPTCEPDESCHHHASVGTIACATAPPAAVEVANRGEGVAPVLLVIGICSPRELCGPM